MMTLVSFTAVLNTASDFLAVQTRGQANMAQAGGRGAAAPRTVTLLKRLKAALLATALGASLMPQTAVATDNSTSPPVPSVKSWLAASELKVAGGPTNLRVELQALKVVTAQRTTDDLDRYRWWATGGPVYRWNEILLDEMQESFVVLPMAARHLALFHAALDDAVTAARRQQNGSAGRANAGIDGALDPKRVASGPSEHAAAAVAAGEILANLFPVRAAYFKARAEEAIQARLLAGVELPHESASGREVGRQAAELALARSDSDYAYVKWTGSVPEGPGKWKGTNPIMPQAVQWRPWVLASASEFRPAAPPPIDSEQVKAALAELKGFQRTPKTNHRATYWEVHGGARAHTLWNDLARIRILEQRLAPEVASRVLAALNIALADAAVACWDAKYAFWYIRPPQLDPELKSLFAPPNHPSYPAAHGCISTAAATVLAHTFPIDRQRLLALGKEAAEARVWAGIHYRFDIDAGQEIGRKVAKRVLEEAFAERVN